MPDTLLTFEALATLSGASLLTYLVVQYTKSLVDRVTGGRLPTDLYAVLVGAVVLLLAQLATGAGAADWRVYVLSLANGFLVAATAGKLNDAALRPPGRTPDAGM
jgi:hypothetical protein